MTTKKDVPMGRLLPCVCNTNDGWHMPAVTVVRVNPENPDEILEVMIENVCMIFRTKDPEEAFDRAVDDFNSASEECSDKGDWDECMRCAIDKLREKGYVLTPKSISALRYAAVDYAPDKTIH
jgi:hypothetical protein